MFMSEALTFKNLKWMNVIQRRDYFVALSAFKCIHGMSPSYLSAGITMYNEIAVNNNNNKQIYLQPHRVGFTYTVHTSI